MKTAQAIADRIDRFVERIGRLAAWSIFLLMGVTVFDVITRRFLVLGSSKLQELEWHFHVVLFACCLGFALTKNAHVRIEILQTRYSERTRLWIEFLGGLLLVLPFCGLLVYFGALFTIDSFVDNEVSASATGLSHRWIIKSFLPFGFLLLALAATASTLRSGLKLFSSEDSRK